MNATDLQTYGVNLLIHTLLLSLVAFAAASSFKNPHARSLAAALGLLALSFTPWISALQIPARHPVAEIPIARVQVSQPLTKPIVNTASVEVRKLITESSEPVKFKLPDPWMLLAGIWALGFVFQTIRMSVSSIHLARWKSSLRHATDSELQTLGENPLPHPYRVLISEVGSSPCVTGCFRACLVIPQSLLAPGRKRELDWSLRHEAGHLRGHDLQWLALFQLLLALLWWNPVAHRLVRVWADAREQVCDDLAVTEPQDRAPYGKFLVTLGARHMEGTILAMADRGNMARLKHRIHFLMEGSSCHPCGRRFIAGGTLTAILAGLCVSQVGVRAEKPEQTKVAPVEIAVEEKAPDTEIDDKPSVSGRPEAIQIKFTSKFLVTSKPFVRDGTILNEEGVRKIMRTLSQTHGVDLMTAPAVTARTGQKAMIEIIREKPQTAGNTGVDPVSRRSRLIDDFDYQFAGIRLEYLAEASGDEIQMTYKLAIGHVPDSGLNQFDHMDPKAIPWEKVRKLRADGRKLLKPSESLCVSVGEIDPGLDLTMIVTADRIDATGRPVDASGQLLNQPDTSILSEAAPKPEPPAPLPPFTLFVDGVVATLPNDTVQKILGTSTTTPPCYVIADSKELDQALKNTPAENLIALPRVETRKSVVPLQLWKELPDFHASYTRSDLPHLASFWWACVPDLKSPNEITGSIGLVGDHYWCFELPSNSAETRRLLILNVDMVAK